MMCRGLWRHWRRRVEFSYVGCDHLVLPSLEGKDLSQHDDRPNATQAILSVDDDTHTLEITQDLF